MKHSNSKTKLLISAVFGLSAFNATAVDLGEFNGTQLSIGGYIKAEGVFNRPDDDALWDADDSFEGHVRESRINFKASSVVDGHKITGFIESDFYGGFFESSTYDLRLRHAYIQLDNWTVGKNWSGQFFAVAPMDARILNFWGSGAGTIAGVGATIRPDLLIHYRNKGFMFTAQDPIYTEADIPDMVANYTKRFRGGSGYTLAVTGREVENGTGSDLGAGISLAGQIAIGRNRLHLSTYTGKGMGVYSGVGVGGAYTPNNVSTLDAENGSLVSQTGFSVGYTHKFSPKLTGVVRYGQVNVDDIDDTELNMTNINLVYSYLPNLDVGIEWRDQNIGTLNSPNATFTAPGGAFPNIRPKGRQVEVMAKFKF